MTVKRTQIGIIGAGPAGLMLARLLMEQGISSVILEAKTRKYVENRIRAGVLESGTVELLNRAKADYRLKAEGQIHEGLELSINGQKSRIDLKHYSKGKSVTIYGQTELTIDLINTHLKAGGEIVFDAHNVQPNNFNTPEPNLTYRKNNIDYQIDCDFIAGCDGFHGISRSKIPIKDQNIFERVYPYAWLGILAESPPPSNELIYATHKRGFALYSMRPPSRSRSYLQCSPNLDLSDWPDDRIWDELQTRLGPQIDSHVSPGKIIEKGVTPMRSFVVEPLRYGNLFLAGDAAHIVPPTGAKGLNLAMSDIQYLADAFLDFYNNKSFTGINNYSDRALSRIWKTERFSWWMTSILHKTKNESSFDDRIRLTELEYLLSSEAAMRSFAENYVGLPF